MADPVFRALAVVPREGKEDWWMPIGAAFLSRSRDSYTVVLQALPLPQGDGTCKLVLRPWEATKHAHPGIADPQPPEIRHVVMGNDFPNAVFSTEEEAEAYCRRKRDHDAIERQREGRSWAPGIHWRVYSFEVDKEVPR